MDLSSLNNIHFSSLSLTLLAASLSVSLGQAAELQPFNSDSDSTAITIDGNLDEWGKDGWTSIALHPAVDDDAKNLVGHINVDAKSIRSADMVYFAFRWPDIHPDIEYKNWVWLGNRYRRGKEHDDMFALRFEMSGDYDSCMLSKQTYAVDVWLWTAGRSDPHGFAEDMTQQISSQMLDNAAEYEGPDKQIVYIKKRKDDGTAIYRNTRPDRKKKITNKLPGIEPNDSPAGSVADVRAKGQWLDGYWHLEMARKLVTGHNDDVTLAPGQTIRGAIAVFNNGGAEHKSKSDTLLFSLKP